MAITHVSTASSSTQGAGGVDNESLTFNLSGGTGRKIFVRFGMDQTTPFGDVESVTFDGQACTLVGGARLDNGSFETTAFLYYYDVPDATSSGNKIAAVTFTDTTVDIALVVSEFTGVALGDESSTDFDEVTSGNTTCNLTAPSGNSIGIDVAAANVIANLTVAGTNQVERVEVDVDDYTLSTSETSFSTSGAKTMVWSYSTGGRRVHVAGLWAEAGADIGLFSGAGSAAAPTASGAARLLGKLSGEAAAAAPVATGDARLLGAVSGAAAAAAPVASGVARHVTRLSGDATTGAPLASGAARIVGKLSAAAVASAPVSAGRVMMLGRLAGVANAAPPAASGTLFSVAASLIGAGVAAAPNASGAMRLVARLTGAAAAGASTGLGVARLLGKWSATANAAAPTASGGLRLPPAVEGYFIGAASAAEASASGGLRLNPFHYPLEPSNSPAFTDPLAAASPGYAYPAELSNATTPSYPGEPSVSPSFAYPLE